MAHAWLVGHECQPQAAQMIFPVPSMGKVLEVALLALVRLGFLAADLAAAMLPSVPGTALFMPHTAVTMPSQPCDSQRNDHAKPALAVTMPSLPCASHYFACDSQRNDHAEPALCTGS
eukprot:1159929-Pelagomonas_calceolata.AAC.15